MQKDDDLIHAFKRGSAGAFKKLYYRHKDRAYFYALALTGSEHAAQDALQEAFIAFIRNIRNYRPRGGFRSYLFAAVRSRAIDASRKEDSRREVAQTETLDLFEQADTGDYTRSELSRIVSANLMELPLEQREVVALKVYNDMTFGEVAALTGTSVNTAASRYRYACEKLRSKLMGVLENG